MLNKKIIDFGVIIITSIFWVIVILYSLKFAIPNSAIKLPKDDRAISSFFKLILPEGFGFFTRNPRETRFLLYKAADKRMYLATEPNASLTNLFGLSRKSRCENLEMSYILSKVQKEDWFKCKTIFNECLNYQDTPILLIKNSYSNPMLCGTYVIVMQEPIPWAWSAQLKPEIMPLFFTKINVVCQ